MIDTLEKRILVIEDNVEERAHVQNALTKAGFRNFDVVQDLASGLNIMKNYDGIISDLFFPAGNVSADQYVQRFLPVYEEYKEEKFERIAEDSMESSVIAGMAEMFEMTPKEYFEQILVNMGSVGLETSRDAVYGRRNYSQYLKFEKVEEQIRNGTNLPLGIISSEYAQQIGKPVVIVTSSKNHDLAFEPVKGSIQVPYLNNLVDGRKNWEGGIESLISQFGETQ